MRKKQNLARGVLAVGGLCYLIFPSASQTLHPQQERQPVPCLAIQIPLQLRPDSGPSFASGLKVISSSLNLDPSSFPTSTLTLKNETTKPLSAVTMLVSYFDREGQPLFSISFVGGLSRSESNLPPHMRPFIFTVWKQPIQHGEVFSLTGSNLMNASVVPVNSRASRIQLEFAGETASDTGILQGWEGPTDPLPLELPDHLEFALKNVPPHEEALVQLTIDAEGRVLEVTPCDNGTFSPQATNDLRREFMKWSFFPATKHAYAVRTTLALWIKFHTKKLPLPYPACPQTFPDRFPRTFVRVDLQYDKETDWTVSYGGYPASGKFESIESISNGG